MDKPFDISFDFELASSAFIIPLKATAELHHSEPYYVISNFYTGNGKPGKGHPSSLPPQQIRRIRQKRGYTWVHRDSDKETLLSMAIGKAIEKKIGVKNVNK